MLGSSLIVVAEHRLTSDVCVCVHVFQSQSRGSASFAVNGSFDWAASLM